MDDRQFAWEKLLPYIHDITGAISSCPISQKDKNGLAIAASVHFMGVACHFLKEADDKFQGNTLPEIARAVADLVVAAMEQDENKTRN